MKEAIFVFHETKKDDPIMAVINLFGNIINIHPFEDGNGRICRLILGLKFNKDEPFSLAFGCGIIQV